MSNEQKLREAFEARMTDNGKWPRAVEQGRNGCYLLAQTENAWVEWQACAEALATTEPAVNQQLTTEPVDERAAFEKWVTKNGEWPNNALRSRLDPDRYVDIQGLWEAWQARAAKAQVSDINVVESFTNDTKDAERYRCIRRGQHVSVINGIGDMLRAENLDAAIDAAMAQGVKG